MYIGIDLGTSSVKLLLMGNDGKVVGTHSEEYPLSFPNPGWSEQNPEDWYDKTVTGISKLLQKTGTSIDDIDGMGAGGQMHGLVLLDREDRVIRPAILWNDGRTTEEVEYLNETIGKDKITEYTGNIAFAGFTAPKILWVKKNEPENFARISKIMLPKDYLVYRLSGAFTTDYSDASGMLLLDVKNKKWSPEMLEICGITEDMLPALHESYDVVGELIGDVAAGMAPEGIGVNSDRHIRMVAGAGDNAAAAVGTGAVGPGRCNISIGTSGTIFITSDKFVVDSRNSLHAFAHADGGFHLMGCMLSAASCNKWFMDEVLQDKDYSGLQNKICDMDSVSKEDFGKLGNNRVFFLPYLMGERSPHNDPDVRAMFYGMSLDTKREDMYQAVLEGVAYGLRDSLEVARSMGLDISSATICGGGARSKLWLTILANVLKLRLDIPVTEEGPSMGGAMLSAVGCGTFPDIITAGDSIRSVEYSIEPDEELMARYEDGYARFRKLYPAISGLGM